MKTLTTKLLLAVLMAGNAALAEQNPSSVMDWKSMMTVADRKRDTQGNLLPLQSYDETIRRGMAFILVDHLKWFKGPLATLVGQDIAPMPPSQATSLGKHTAAPSRRNPFFNGYASARLKRALYLFDVIVFSPVHGALPSAIAVGIGQAF